MPDQEELCKKCFKEARKRWSSGNDCDLKEGLCPIETEGVWICKKTGERIPTTEVIHIPSLPKIC